MKICRSCKVEKSKDQFHKCKTRGLQYNCKLCRKAVDQKYWEKRKKDPSKMAAKKIWLKSRQEENREYIFNFLINNPCPCGETNPVKLTFDHLHDKINTISDMATRNVSSLKNLKLEIDKCQVLCSNCHMLKTAKDFNWWIYKMCKDKNLI